MHIWALILTVPVSRQLALPGVPGASAKTSNSTPDRLDVINNLRKMPDVLRVTRMLA